MILATRRMRPRRSSTTSYICGLAGCCTVSLTTRSRLELSNGLPSKLAELPKPAGVEIGKLGIVQAEQIENRHVDIPHRMDHFHSLLPNLIGRADNRSRPSTAA